jgi:hypothetical protein
VLAVKVVREFHQLRVAVEPIVPAVLTVVLRLINHVQQVLTVVQPNVLDCEVLPPHLTNEFRRYDWGVAVLVGLEFRWDGRDERLLLLSFGP